MSSRLVPIFVTPFPSIGGLQNSPYFCVFKYARAVKQKVWNEAENRERDWGETLFFLSPHTPVRHVRLAPFARKTLTPRFTDFFTDFEKKTDCFAVYLFGGNSTGHYVSFSPKRSWRN